jgi:hypothetical protein
MRIVILALGSQETWLILFVNACQPNCADPAIKIRCKRFAEQPPKCKNLFKISALIRPSRHESQQ